VQRVAPKEIKIIDLGTTSPVLLEITNPGNYAVFTGHESISVGLARFLENNNEISLEIKSQTTGEQIKIVPVERGIRPYDTPLAEGRPRFGFEITVPDKYEITFKDPHYYGGDAFAIVPDYATGKESVISFAYIIQIAILLTLLGIVYYLRYQRDRARIKSIEANQKQMQIKGQAFWAAEMQRDQKKTQKGNE
jgi:hypothetical protein